MLMTKKEHARLVMADTKKLGEQAELITKLRKEISEVKQHRVDLFKANLKLAVDNERLTARLAVFTAPRKRNSRGWFVSGKQEQAA